MSFELSLEKISNLAKRRGFVFPGSEIYGGLSNSWDYGPLGVLLKKNIQDAWWRYFVVERDDMVGLDAAIMMNPKVWEASGHVASFNDPLIDCRQCKARHRADHLIETFDSDVNVEGMTLEDMTKYISNNEVKCPKCGNRDFTDVRTFNLLFETSLGTTEGDKRTVYLRGELAQSMFVDFKQIMETSRKKIPFGIAQVGKAFRNEITPGNFTFRTLEFDLMEFEYFVREENWEESFSYWLEEMQKFAESVGLAKDNLRVREHEQEELSHYSKKTVDIEYNTPFGWKEMFGLAYRTDFDLKNHAEQSGVDLQVLDTETNTKYFPHVVEPTFGLTRLMLMVMLSAYTEEEVPVQDGKEGPAEMRVVMKFPPHLAPYQVAVLPLMKKEELARPAKELAMALKKKFSCEYDETQSIGKRYRRQDEIGTPWCVTFDFDSLEHNSVTIRDRDSMMQERVKIDEVESWIEGKLVSH